jgi:hypothetical protein
MNPPINDLYNKSSVANLANIQTGFLPYAIGLSFYLTEKILHPALPSRIRQVPVLQASMLHVY